MGRPSPEAKAAFARRLRAAMRERGLTGAETARRMAEYLPDGRASRATISHYQSGRGLPSRRYLDALSRALGVASSDLLPLSDTEERTAVSQARTVPVHVFPANENPQPRQQASADVSRCYIEDLGEEVHLRIRQRVSWEVAFKILEVLKRDQQPP